MSEIGWPEIAAHRERLVRIARRRCPTREDAEDVVQEAMLRCATFEGLDGARLGAFLTSVTVRLCADLYRDAVRSQRAVSRLVLGDAPHPEDAVLRATEAAVLGDLLSALPTKQRDVLVDRACGLSVSQIGVRHALTYKAVESALSRARSAMRTAIASTLSVLGGGVAFVRRRPAVLAVPVATLALYGSVHAPWAELLLPGATPPNGSAADTYLPPDRIDRAAAVTPDGGNETGAVPPRRATAEALPGSPRHETSKVKAGSIIDVTGSDTGDGNGLPTVDDTVQCVTDGPTVMVWFTGPSTHAGFTKACGHAAQPGGDR